ncbi:MAG: hypothetical protein ABI467_10800 [Kofleriaceae bacterium]
MFAHRAGTVGALVAVVILSVELVGAIAWKHHALRADRHEHWATLRGTELVLEHARAAQLGPTLEQVTLARQSNER